MGVQLINLSKRDAVVGIARNAEAGAEAEEVEQTDGARDAGPEAEGTEDAAGTGAAVEAAGDTESPAGEHEE